jgi:mono/diheme cytochrome c family protein
MRQGRLRWIWVLGVLLAAEQVWLAYPWSRATVLQLEESDVARGERVANELGCFSCHGPGGRGGVTNLGSQDETVPSFNEETPMMFVKNDNEIREQILDGAPATKRARASYREAMEGQAIGMPAYRGWVKDADVTALVAYVRAVSGMLKPADPLVKRGASLARKNGCFACHGEMGNGGIANPGSFKGYIPAFTGADFKELVRSDEELLSWLREGSIARIRQHPIGSRFLARQRIPMPAYGKFLGDEDISAIAAYVRWLADGEWRRQPLSADSSAPQTARRDGP